MDLLNREKNRKEEEIIVSLEKFQARIKYQILTGSSNLLFLLLLSF